MYPKPYLYFFFLFFVGLVGGIRGISVGLVGGSVLHKFQIVHVHVRAILPTNVMGSWPNSFTVDRLL